MTDDSAPAYYYILAAAAPVSSSLVIVGVCEVVRRLWRRRRRLVVEVIGIDVSPNRVYMIFLDAKRGEILGMQDMRTSFTFDDEHADHKLAAQLEAMLLLRFGSAASVEPHYIVSTVSTERQASGNSTAALDTLNALIQFKGIAFDNNLGYGDGSLRRLDICTRQCALAVAGTYLHGHVVPPPVGESRLLVSCHIDDDRVICVVYLVAWDSIHSVRMRILTDTIGLGDGLCSMDTGDRVIADFIASRFNPLLDVIALDLSRHGGTPRNVAFALTGNGRHHHLIEDAIASRPILKLWLPQDHLDVDIFALGAAILAAGLQDSATPYVSIKLFSPLFPSLTFLLQRLAENRSAVGDSRHRQGLGSGLTRSSSDVLSYVSDGPVASREGAAQPHARDPGSLSGSANSQGSGLGLLISSAAARPATGGGSTAHTPILSGSAPTSGLTGLRSTRSSGAKWRTADDDDGEDSDEVALTPIPTSSDTTPPNLAPALAASAGSTASSSGTGGAHSPLLANAEHVGPRPTLANYGSADAVEDDD